MDNTSILHSAKTKSTVERVMHIIFIVCGLTAVITVAFISLYMIFSGGPAIAKIGVAEFLFSDVWNPEQGAFGILPMILSSIVATGVAVLIAVPVGLAAAIFLTHMAGKKSGEAFLFVIELLASIPSVVYGLLGAILIAPGIFEIQKRHIPRTRPIASRYG